MCEDMGPCLITGTESRKRVAAPEENLSPNSQSLGNAYQTAKDQQDQQGKGEGSQRVYLGPMHGAETVRGGVGNQRCASQASVTTATRGALLETQIPVLHSQKFEFSSTGA